MSFVPIHLENVSQLQVFQETTRGWIAQLVWSPNGNLLACGSAGGVAIWRGALDGQQVFIKQHEGPVKGVGFAPNGTTFATGSADTFVKVWDLRAYSPTMEPIETYSDHQDAVEKVLIAGNGAVVSCSVDKTVRVLRRLGKMTLEGHTDEVNTIALSRDNSMIASGSHDKTARVWDMMSGKQISVLEGHNDWVRVVQFHPKEAVLMTASRDTSVRLWDVSDLDNPKLQMAFQHQGDVRAATFDATGDLLATGSTDGNITVWDTRSGEKLAMLEKHTMPVVALAFHPKNNLLASGGGDNQVCLWGIE